MTNKNIGNSSYYRRIKIFNDSGSKVKFLFRKSGRFIARNFRIKSNTLVFQLPTLSESNPFFKLCLYRSIRETHLFSSF